MHRRGSKIADSADMVRRTMAHDHKPSLSRRLVASWRLPQIRATVWSSRASLAVILAASIPALGCFPTLPPHLAEGTEVLEPKKVGLAFVGGGGGFAANCCKQGASEEGGGLEARVRVGVGARQEIGAAFFAGIGSVVGGGDPPFVVGGKGTYKIAPLRWLAVVADGGGMVFRVAGVAVLGGDLAFIAAPYIAPNGTQLYTGFKVGFSVPVLNNAQATNESFTVPIGVSLHVSRRTRLIFESGFVMGLSQVRSGAQPSPSQDAASPGGYGLFAFAYDFR
jgi:hypothetical protein